jgi:hypothetical protein
MHKQPSLAVNSFGDVGAISVAAATAGSSMRYSAVITYVCFEYIIIIIINTIIITIIVIIFIIIVSIIIILLLLLLLFS